MTFRVTELQTLLGFAGKNKTGKKNDLQARAVNLLQRGNLTLSVQNKIRELYRQRYTGNSASSEVQPSEISSSNYSQNKTSLSSHSKCLSNPNSSNKFSSSSNLNSHISSNDYYFSMPRSLTSDFNTNSPSNIKPYIPSLAYPVLADVKFKPLSFYDIFGELLKPATLSKFSKYQKSNKCLTHFLFSLHFVILYLF